MIMVNEDNNKNHNNFYCPDEILIEILSRVPADRLLVFKRVCIHWRVLISSYSFLKLQIKRAKEEAINKPAMFVQGRECCSIVKISKQATSTHRLVNFQRNLKQCNAFIAIGSCDGLLLFPLLFEPGSLIVNPITQETRLVSRPNEKGDACCIFLDRFEDDYKLLHLTGFPLNRPHDHYIYSFKGDDWRTLISVDTHHRFQPRLEDGPVVVADSLHWIGYSNVPCSKMVLVFKIETKDFSFMPYPKGIDTEFVVQTNCCLSLEQDELSYFHHNEQMQLIEKDGQLGLCHRIVKRKVIEIWFLQHYEDSGSWARKFTIELSYDGGDYFYKTVMKVVKTVSFVNDDDVLLASSWNTQLYLYNLETRNIKVVGSGRYFSTPLTLTLLSPNNVHSIL